MTSRKFIPRHLVCDTQLTFVYLVLFLRHYSLKRRTIIVAARDLEKANFPRELDQGMEEKYSEKQASETSNDNGDDDDKKIVEVDEKQLDSLEVLESHGVVIKQFEIHV